MPALPSSDFAFRDRCRSPSTRRHGYRARSLQRIPLYIDRRDDIADNNEIIFEDAEELGSVRTVRRQFGDRLAVLGDDDDLAAARDFIHQGEALGLEFGGFDVARHHGIPRYDHGHGPWSYRRDLRDVKPPRTYRLSD